jgi:hypothetical protein
MAAIGTTEIGTTAAIGTTAISIPAIGPTAATGVIITTIGTELT